MGTTDFTVEKGDDAKGTSKKGDFTMEKGPGKGKVKQEKVGLGMGTWYAVCT